VRLSFRFAPLDVALSRFVRAVRLSFRFAPLDVALSRFVRAVRLSFRFASLDVALSRYQKTTGDIVSRASSHDTPCCFLAPLVVTRNFLLSLRRKFGTMGIALSF
jgi:hypothetical protein